MKKLFVLLPVLLLVAVSAFAGRFAKSATTDPYYWEEIATISPADSVVTAVDSCILFVKKTFQRGCGYAVQTTDSVNADTLVVKAHLYTSGNTYIGTVTCDTILTQGTAHVYPLHNIPVGQTCIASKFSISVYGIGATVAKVRRAALWRYRLLQSNIDWTVEP